MKNRESSGWSSITPQFEPRFQTQPRSGSSPSSAFLAPNFNGHVKPSPRLAANLKLHEEYDEEELAVAFDAEAVVGAVNNGAEVEYGEERECVDEEEGEDEEEEEDEDVAGEAEEQGRPKLADGFYEIESIRKKRIFKGQPQYLIKWLGWPDSSNTWEPLEHLQACADVVEAFEERQSAEKKTYRKRKCQFTQPKKKMQYAYGLSKSKAAFIELPFSEKASNLKPPLPSTNGHAVGPTEYYDEEPSSATKDSEESPVNCQTIGSKEKNHDGDNNHEGVNANKFSLQFQPILSLDGEKSQICLSKVENKDPTPSQRDRCPGATQRKSGFVRRFKQDTTSFGPTCAQNYGIIDLTSCDRMGRQMGNNNFDLNASAITRILNPIGYSPSVSNDVHDVSVTFMAMRADGEEVLVDNKFLKANNPLLLINFYEQHLRYSPPTS
ncbi:La ribonucleoprotein [Dionaea muscipula]